MTLKDKFQQWFINDEDEHYEGMVETVAIEHEQIADEFAIEFAEYCLMIFGRLRDNEITIEEALEIYKKEKDESNFSR
jgi:hypothetical protein